MSHAIKSGVPLEPATWTGEWRALFELPRTVLRAPALARGARGSGEPVLVLPGYRTSDSSTFVLRSYLRWLGYQALVWGLGRNDGNAWSLLPKIKARVEALADQTGARVALVGWSLGGYLAREAARDLPDTVECVVTLGAPVVGGPKYTRAANLYRARGVDLDAIEAAVDARYRVPLTRPVTAIFSRRDGIVAWNACIDARSPRVEHVEVGATHFGMGLSAEVLLVIAARLGRAWERSEERSGP